MTSREERYDLRIRFASKRILGYAQDTIICALHQEQPFNLFFLPVSSSFSRVCVSCTKMLFPDVREAEKNKVDECAYEDCTNAAVKAMNCGNCKGNFCLAHMAADDMCCIKCVREADEEYGPDNFE